MIYIESPWTDPYTNLSLEEYMLTGFEDEVFMLWRNDKSVIIGRNQNTLSEINTDYVREKGIAVVRRLTGGGAVFHDLGNLNFSFMVKNEHGLFSDFHRFTAPIVEALRSYGLDAGFDGRNDITIGGLKVSGNAQTIYKGRFLHHGTLLFNVDFSDLAAALNVDSRKISSKGIRSVQKRVTNISEHADIPIQEFMSKIMTGKLYELNEKDITAVMKLRGEKYSTWEWNYGYSPKYSYRNGIHTKGGIVEVYMDVNGGIITGIKFYGDFFAAATLQR